MSEDNLTASDIGSPFSFKKKIVIVDDDFIIRQQLKNVLGTLVNADLYSSQNGLEGIGLCILLNPDVIIIDSTLPRYSGRELLDFLNTNPKFHSENTTVIVLNEETSAICTIKNCYNISKKDPELIKKIAEIVGTGKSISHTRFNIAQSTIRWANKGDITYNSIQSSAKSNQILKPLKYVQWFFYEVVTSIFLVISSLLFKKVEDTNLVQDKIDSAKYRSRVMPTLATGTAAIFLTLFQVLLFVSGGVVVLNTRIISVFADLSPEVQINLADSAYDSSKIELWDGTLRLKPIVTTQEPITDNQDQLPIEEPPVETIPEEETPVEEIPTEVVPPVAPEPTEPAPSEEVVVPPSEEVEPEVLGVAEDIQSETPQAQGIETISYASDHPEVIFNQSVEFSSLSKLSHNIAADQGNSVTYQLSPDKSNWYYVNSDSVWEKTEAGFSSSDTPEEISANLETYMSSVGGNNLYLKAFLNSNGNSGVQINRINVERDLNVVTPINEPEEIDVEDEELLTLDLENLVSFPVSSPIADEVSAIELPTPVILNAAFAQGNKVVTGNLEGKVLIPSEQLKDIKVNVYFTNSTDININATGVTSLIGTADLIEITTNGLPEYVFELRVPSVPGGYITAELVYTKIKADGSTEEIKSKLSNPSES
jgi:CheY-like chemotaxis protein